MKIIRHFMESVLFLMACSCMEGTPLDEEQYIKQVYLANSYDILYETTLEYSDEIQETFVSVASSGSLPLDKDAVVILGLDTAAVRLYNEKYLGNQKKNQYYKVLPVSKYEIPEWSVTLRADEQVYERCPIYVRTADLSCDSAYVIALSIVSSAIYPVSQGLKTILLTLKLKNQYSGIYQMVGERVNGESRQPIAKSKMLTAYSRNQLRMYVDVLQEETEKIREIGVLLDIHPDNSVTLTPYGTLNIRPIRDGVYDPEKKNIQLWYEYTLDGKTWQVTETLARK